MIVAADSSPLNYLLIIRQSHILPPSSAVFLFSECSERTRPSGSTRGGPQLHKGASGVAGNPEPAGQ